MLLLNDRYFSEAINIILDEKNNTERSYNHDQLDIEMATVNGDFFSFNLLILASFCT